MEDKIKFAFAACVAAGLFLVGCGGDASRSAPTTLIHTAQQMTLTRDPSNSNLYTLLLTEPAQQLTVYRSLDPMVGEEDRPLHQGDLARLWSAYGAEQPFDAQLKATDTSTGEPVTLDLKVSLPTQVEISNYSYQVQIIAEPSESTPKQRVRVAVVSDESQFTNSQLIVRDPFGALSLTSLPRYLVKTSTLEVATTQDMTFVTNDSGSGAKMSFSSYRVNPPPGFYTLSHRIAKMRGGRLVETLVEGLLISAPQDATTTGKRLLTPPVTFHQFWTDRGSGADRNLAIWVPVPEADYTCLGLAISTSYSQYADADYRCVRSDLAQGQGGGSLVWNDHGTGANQDVSVFSPIPNSWTISVGLAFPVNRYLPTDSPVIQNVLRDAATLAAIVP